MPTSQRHALNAPASASPQRGVQHVCVIGAGIAGLACALAAVKSGASVQIFDERAGPRVLPAQVEAVPSMLRDLVALGVGDECIRAGFAYNGIDIVDRRGNILLELPTERLLGARYPAAIGICHGDLQSVLSQAAHAHGVKFCWGSTVAAVKPQHSNALLKLASGEQIEADLVVLAVGASSPLRHTLFRGALPVQPVGQAWWYTLLKRPVDLNRPRIAIGGDGQRVVLVPVRSNLAGLVLIEPAEPNSDAPTSLAVHLRTALQRFGPQTEAIAKQIRDDAPVMLRLAHSGLLPLPWHCGRVLAVGECAHALPPHFGQSVAQDVEDASVLAELLSANADYPTLAAAFTERRVKRVQRVYELATTAARWDIQPELATNFGELMSSLARTVAQAA